ncbi:MAG TPA: GH116 family glycosyl-hydrolase, partial [Bacteroidales bacterium]|nr:GH116 family glycosyl-hydrolase [Bacteroidales bacterium]
MRLIILSTVISLALLSCENNRFAKESEGHRYNGTYTGDNLNRVAFPIGGIGAGMFCLDGNGAFSHMSVRHKPDVFNTPFMFAALSVKGVENGAKILEGPVQDWKIFGSPNTGNGSSLFGVPRYNNADFEARFPFGEVNLTDDDMPVDVTITGWSPFVPTDADNSSLPVGGLEYTFTNTSSKDLEAMFAFNSENFMRVTRPSEWGGVPVGKDSIGAVPNGFVLDQSCFPDNPEYKGDFAIFTDDPEVVVDHCWFRGGWFDARTVLWKHMENVEPRQSPVTKGASGASIFVPFKLKAGEKKTVKVYMVWYVPHSDLRVGWSPEDSALKAQAKTVSCEPGSDCCSPASSLNYEPWYDSKFDDVRDVASYWLTNYSDLRKKSQLFSETFYGSDVPDEVLEAVSANLTILKSPTVLRQKDGRLWAWEGCHDLGGCCYGSCTHVWNYAQAISHLFPSLERSLRETEFHEDQSTAGHQTFRANLPIRPTGHGFYAASDGQLGGIMKMYREWRISGDTEWLRSLWPQVKTSLDYCIRDWDPRHTGALEEPHHNTYDIEFWGPDGMCTSFYVGALTAAVEMGKALNDEVPLYKELLNKGLNRMNTDLYNGEYFFQEVQWTGLDAPNPVEASKISMGGAYSPEALKILEQEGPKYQYGNGCISDGVLGFWLSK